MQISTSVESLQHVASSPPNNNKQSNYIPPPPQTVSNVPLAAPLEAKIIPRNDPISSPTQSAGRPPQRPRREGDEEFRRALSPTSNGPPSPTQPLSRVISPNGSSSPPQVKNGFNPSLVVARSPSPRMRQADAPSDAFYYGRSPTTNGFPNRPTSLSGTADLLRDLKTKDTELEAGRKREAAMRVLLARAVQQGFVTKDDEEDLSNGKESPEVGEDVIRKLASALVRMKQEKAAIQVSFTSNYIANE